MTDEQPIAGIQRDRKYADQGRGQRKALMGRVISTTMSKTVVVAIERTERHRKYKKYVRKHSKVYAHDEKEQARVGDIVRVTEGRPKSKLKRFYLTSVVKKSTRVEA